MRKILFEMIDFVYCAYTYEIIQKIYLTKRKEFIYYYKHK